MTKDMTSWIKSGAYLPEVMRDFHDQKDLFKALHQTVNVEKHKYAGSVDWVAGQCYTVDIFLWWMAQHGYTLQRSRQKHDFRDIWASVSKAKDERDRQSLTVLSAIMGATP